MGVLFHDMLSKMTNHTINTLWKNCIWACIYYVLYLIVYYSLCQRHGLHWDEVLDMHGEANDTYCALGRWSLWMYRIIFGTGAQLASAGLIAGGFISIAAVIQTSLLNLKAPWLKALYGILLMASYQWAAQLHYSHQSDAVALGLLICTVAAILTYNGKGLVHLIFATFLLAVGIGFYQSLTLLYVIVWITMLIVDNSQKFPSLLIRKMAIACAVSCCSLLLWWIGKFLSLHCIPVETMEWAHGYLTDMSEWQAILAAHDVSYQFGLLWHYLRLSLSNASGLGKASYWIFATALIPLAGLLLRQMRSKRGLDRIVSCLLTLALWWIPFSLPFFIMSPAMGMRTWVAEPFSFAALWLLWVRDLQVARGWRIASICIALALMSSTAVHVYEIASIETVQHRGTLSTLSQLHQRAMELARQKGMQNPDIVVFGSFDKNEYPDLVTTVFDDPIMNWYCKQYRLTGMHKANSSDVKTYGAQVEAMAKWPEAASVSAAGESTILIRLPKGN